MSSIASFLLAKNWSTTHLPNHSNLMASWIRDLSTKMQCGLVRKFHMHIRIGLKIGGNPFNPFHPIGLDNPWIATPHHTPWPQCHTTAEHPICTVLAEHPIAASPLSRSGHVTPGLLGLFTLILRPLLTRWAMLGHGQGKGAKDGHGDMELATGVK